MEDKLSSTKKQSKDGGLQRMLHESPTKMQAVRLANTRHSESVWQLIVAMTLWSTQKTASKSSQGTIMNMEVVEDFESRPHKAINLSGGERQTDSEKCGS